MSVKVTDKITADGKKLQKILKELADKEVRVGFQQGKTTEEDGTLRLGTSLELSICRLVPFCV